MHPDCTIHVRQSRLRRLEVAMSLFTAVGLIGCTHSHNSANESYTPLFQVPRALHAKNSLSQKPTPLELQTRLMSFVDRYFSKIAAVADYLEKNAKSAEIKKLATALSLFPRENVLSIATESDPEEALLDMVTVVSLERMVWGDGWAQSAFGRDAKRLTDVQEELERQIWVLAGDILAPNELSSLRQLIVEWRLAHPQQRYVSSVRFDDFTKLHTWDSEDQKLKRGGFLAPLDDAAVAIDQTRRFAERSLFAAQRMPVLLSAYAKFTTYEVLDVEDLHKSLVAMEQATRAMERVSTSFEKLPAFLQAERKAFFAELNADKSVLQNLVRDVRGGLNEVDALTPKIKDTVETTTRLVAGTKDTSESIARMINVLDDFSTPDEGTPQTDWNVHLRLAERIENTAKEINHLLDKLQNPDAAAPRNFPLLWFLVWTQILVMVIGCVLLLVTLLIYQRSQKRSQRQLAARASNQA